MFVFILCITRSNTVRSRQFRDGLFSSVSQGRCDPLLSARSDLWASIERHSPHTPGAGKRYAREGPRRKAAAAPHSSELEMDAAASRSGSSDNMAPLSNTETGPSTSRIIHNFGGTMHVYVNVVPIQ